MLEPAGKSWTIVVWDSVVWWLKRRQCYEGSVLDGCESAVLKHCFVVQGNEGLLCELCGETRSMSLRWD